ncbi:hypothetical protein ATN84_01275 [Paramesorhizobium deserti]|uniref:Arylsulfotransferase n=1 Tax=Paramesorhizobium deserti TaxID=1494590 RepID=A0A135I214_9HYPH|nr:hypothetical protein ATN84_01275 [Paramesorhizobium deserti]
MDRVLRTVSMMGCALLLFIAGAITTTSEIFPGPQIAAAYEGGRALYDKVVNYQNVYETDLWYPQSSPKKGVTTYVSGKAHDGLTLYTSGDGPAAYLIDMNGKVVHEWRRPFSTVWPNGPHGKLWQAGAQTVSKPQADPFVYFRQAHVFPNGDLLALYEGAGDTPYGYGLVKLDKNSNVIWSYAGRAHHQFDIGPDGKIYVLTHEYSKERLKYYGHLKPPRLDDYLVVLSPDGEELEKIHLMNALGDSPFRQLGYSVSSFSVAEPLHANAVNYITKEMAANFPFAREGQILLSFRELGTGTVAVLDPGAKQIAWATNGPWIGQHDPDILPNGNILLFDNFGNFRGPKGRTRIIEFDPRTMEIVWRYTGTAEHPLESPIRGEQQRLANGNTLIDESTGGRLVEVTQDGQIVWEFLNPARGGDDNNKIAIFGWAQRLSPSDLEFLGKPDGTRQPDQETRT